MFWPIASGRIDARAYGLPPVAFRTGETAELNAWASAGEPDVCAVSIAHLPAIARAYDLLASGGSLGRNYGPVLVAREPLAAAALAHRRVGIPGATTTAARLLALAVPAALAVPVPFARTFPALDAGEVDAAVVIHEGRLAYAALGYHLVLDLGAFWHTHTGGLPLPLGGNVVRRALGPAATAAVARLCHDSIAFALANREQALDALLPARPALSRDAARAYLDLYANADSLDYSPDARRAIELLTA